MSSFTAPTFDQAVPGPISLRRLSIWSSWVFAALTSSAITLIFIASSQKFLHWFCVPVLICGILTGKHAFDWLLGRVQAFDVWAIFGLFGYFFFFLSPLLHVQWDFWMWEAVPPADWRPWLGGVAALNAVGLALLLAVGSSYKVKRRLPASSVVWVLDFHVLPAISFMTLLSTALFQGWVYMKAGGLSAFVNTFHESYASAEDQFAGWGWIFMLSESFPIVAAFTFVAYARKRRWILREWQFILALLCFFSLQIFFGGLRGSRLNTAEGLFWAVGAYHYFVKPISRSAILAGTLGLIGFMYVYGFYKDGTKISTAFASSEVRDEAQRSFHRSFQSLILGDLGRSDVQAYILYKTVTDPASFWRANGQTYVSAITLLIPQRFRPQPLVDKKRIGSDLIWGPGVFTPGVIWSTRIYGLAGEALLNFGLIGVPFAFFILGLVITGLKIWVDSLHQEDARLLIVPFLTYLCCVWAISSDLDNVVFSILKQGFVAGLVLLGITKRVRVGRRASFQPLQTPAFSS